MNNREREALTDAANRPGGWGLFKLRTTMRLVEKGYFEKAEHPAYGRQFRITDAGRAALKSAERGEN